MRKRNGEPVLPSRATTGPSTKRSLSATTWLALIILSSCTSFYLGIWTAWSISPSSSDVNAVNDLCIKAALGEDTGELGRKIGDILQSRVDRGELLPMGWDQFY